MVLRKFALVVLAACVSAVWAADLPRKSPDLVIHLADGKDLSLAQYRGKVVALAFISTTCPHCQHYTQVLSGIQKEYGPRGVQILAAAFNDDAKTLLPGFLAQFQPAFPVGWEDRGNTLAFMEISVLNPGYVPKIAFIDRAGMIQKQFEGTDPFFQDQEKNTRATLEELLKAPAPAKKAGVKTITKR
jgi:thiol-disulfide isomerase/thioredoxin